MAWRLYGATTSPDSKIHGANMGSTWGRQDLGGSHVGHRNLAIWVAPRNPTICSATRLLKFWCWSIYWHVDIVILMKLLSLAALKVVILTTFSAGSYENVVNKTFCFRCEIRNEIVWYDICLRYWVSLRRNCEEINYMYLISRCHVLWNS